MSESFIIGALLAIIGGFFDAYSYLCRGGVFANAQTGNIVLLGVNIANGKMNLVGHYLVPIIAFSLGVFIAEIIRRFFSKSKFHWRQIVVIIEILFVVIVAFLPQKHNMIANTLISFICALQVESFRKVNGSAFATTMCTGNLRSATEQIARWYIDKDKQAITKAIRYLMIIFYFIIGAIIGVFGVKYFSELSVIICSLVLVIVFIMMFWENEL